MQETSRYRRPPGVPGAVSPAGCGAENTAVPGNWVMRSGRPAAACAPESPQPRHQHGTHLPTGTARASFSTIYFPPSLKRSVPERAVGCRWLKEFEVCIRAVIGGGGDTVYKLLPDSALRYYSYQQATVPILTSYSVSSEELSSLSTALLPHSLHTKLVFKQRITGTSRARCILHLPRSPFGMERLPIVEGGRWGWWQETNFASSGVTMTKNNLFLF